MTEKEITIPRESVAYIIDFFEDFLEKKGIDIPNDEKEDNDDAIIYGEDYDILMDGISDILAKAGIKVPETY